MSTHAIGTGFPLITDRRAFGQSSSSTSGEVHSSEPSTMPLFAVTLQCSSDSNEVTLPPGSLMSPRTRSCAELRVRYARNRNRDDVRSSLQTPFDVIDPSYPCLHIGCFSDGVTVNEKSVVISCCNLQPGLLRWHAKKYLLSEISGRSNLRRFDPLGIAEIQLILALLRAEVGLLYVVAEHEPASQDQGP